MAGFRLFSLTPLLAAACALFSIDALIEAKFGQRTYYRHDYGPVNSAKMLKAMLNRKRSIEREVSGPCISTLRERLRSRMVLVAHDGRCVERFAELQWYVIGGLESDAGLVAPPNESCP